MFDGMLAKRDYYSPGLQSQEPPSLDWSDEAEWKTLRVTLPQEQIRISVNPRDVSWLMEGLKQFNRIALLPENWDSYGTSPVKDEVLIYALCAFFELVPYGYRMPQIGATVRGGVSMQWHKANSGLELSIEEPGHIYAYYYSDDEDKEWERDIRNNLDVLGPYLNELRMGKSPDPRPRL